MSGAAGARLSPLTKLPAGNHIQKGQPPVWRAALFGLCPECGAPTLFDGPVKFRPKCDSCGLDYGRYNVGDGPAAFLTLIIGALLIAMALTLDAVLRPPFRSEEHTSELQSLMRISYAVFCLKQKKREHYTH